MRDAELPHKDRTGRDRGSTDSPYRIAFVCSGNICRSPIAEVVVREAVSDAGLADEVAVESSGTGDWHVGERADRRALAMLAGRGYDGSLHRARQFDADDFATVDLVVALDRSHERALRAWARTSEDRAKIHLLRSFDPDLAEGEALDVADPYYGDDDGFATVLRQVEAAVPGLLAYVRGQLAQSG